MPIVQGLSFCLSSRGGSAPADHYRSRQVESAHSMPEVPGFYESASELLTRGWRC